MKKKNLLALIAVMFFLGGIQAQNNILISPKPMDEAHKNMAEKLMQKSRVYESVEFIAIDLSQLKDHRIFTLRFDNKEYAVQKNTMKFESGTNYAFFAKNVEGEGHIILNVRNNDVQGTITHGLELYRIMTMQDGAEYVSVKIDQSKYPEEKCHAISNINEIVDKNTSYTVSADYFSKTMNVAYSLSANSNVAIMLLDSRGVNVMKICEHKNQAAGDYVIPFSVANLSTGVYFIRMRINDKLITEKIFIQ